MHRIAVQLPPLAHGCTCLCARLHPACCLDDSQLRVMPGDKGPQSVWDDLSQRWAGEESAHWELFQMSLISLLS